MRDKKKVEDLYVELLESRLRLREELRSCEERVKQVEGELALVTSQLEVAKQLRNQVLSCEDFVGLERVRDHLVQNPYNTLETHEPGLLGSLPSRLQIA